MDGMVNSLNKSRSESPQKELGYVGIHNGPIQWPVAVVPAMLHGERKGKVEKWPIQKIQK